MEVETKVVNNLVGVESEVHVFFLGDADEKLRARVACMLLAACGELYGCNGSSEGKTCPHMGLSCGSHEFLPNGARAYWDHGYFEYATPACAITSDAVAAVRAGDRMIRNAVAKLEESLKGDAQVMAVRNNTDQKCKGHSFGAHVNVRMTRQGYERIFKDAKVLNGFVVPFFITLPVICGSGRCSDEDSNNVFQIWQRSDFLKELVGLQTTFDRPLVNSRDESLSVDPKYARFHIIAFDANRLEVAEFLKLGLLRLICCAIDLDKIDVSLELTDPIEAVRSISSQPFEPIKLKSNKTITALDIQRTFQAAFTKLYEQDIFADRVPDAVDILTLWEQVLTKLEQDPFSLVGSLDWVTKYAWLEQIRSSKKLKWSSPQMKWLDNRYHSLAGGNAPDMRCERVTIDQQIIKFMSCAAQNPRATIRGELLRRFGNEIQVANWHYVVSFNGEIAYLLPDDPKTGLIEAMDEAKTLEEAAVSLGLTRVQLEHEEQIKEALPNETHEHKEKTVTFIGGHDNGKTN